MAPAHQTPREAAAKGEQRHSEPDMYLLHPSHPWVTTGSDHRLQTQGTIWALSLCVPQRRVDQSKANFLPLPHLTFLGPSEMP